MTINPTNNPSVKASVYQTGFSNTGKTGVMVAYSTYGSGKVVAVGDNSVPEDATAQSGTTYPGWTEPIGGIANADNGVLITNGTIWLAQSTSPSTPPAVQAYYPTDNAITVNITANLAMTFNENIVQGTAGNITIYNSNATVFETIPYNDSRISFLNSIVTIDPTNAFISGSSYYLNIDANVIKDLAGNFYSGISNSTTWNFVTQSSNSILEQTDAEVLVYPNPTYGSVKIIAPKSQGLVSVSVFDINGKVITQINSVNEGCLSFNISNNAMGIYIIKLQMGGKSYMKKLILL